MTKQAIETRGRGWLWLAALLLAGATAFGATPAEAQIGPGRVLPGSPVGTSSVRARFVFAMGNRIIVINEARELFYHELDGNRVGPATRMRGSTVGYGDEFPRYVIPRGRDIYVVSQRGELYRQQIRRESISAPQPIPGTPIGTGGQEPLFMFFLGNRLINVTRNGEIFAFPIRTTVLPGQRIGTYQMRPGATTVTPRAAFPLAGRTIYIVFSNGEVVAHDINPNLGRARMIRSGAVEFGRDDIRWIFPQPRARRLFGIDAQGQVYVHDISRLIPRDAPQE